MNVIEPLLDLQDVDGMIRELEKEEKDLPRRKAQETARLAGSQAAIEIAQSQLNALHQRIKEEETQAEEIRAKVQALKVSQATIESNKELQQSVLQVEGLVRDAEAAENRALALTEDEIPILEARLADAQAKLAHERGGVDGYVEDLDKRLGEVKTRLAELRVQREEKANAVKALDPAFLLYYERISTKRWPAVVSLSSDGVCDGCHMKQPPFVAQLVQHNNAAVKSGQKQSRAVCTMCGRILYNDL